MNTKTVNAQRDGRILTLYLDNPPRNLMTVGMGKELDTLACSIKRDRTIRTVVITSSSPDAFITHFDRLHELFLRWNQMNKVFIAAINGLALGAGCELALACDLRFMVDNERCRIGLPEATFGVIPGGGGTQRLARLLGSGRTLELLLEGKTLNAPEAVAIGLVHRAVAVEQLLEEAYEVAKCLARRSPVTVAATKHAVCKGGSRSLRGGLRIEQTEFLAAASPSQGLRGMSELVRRYPSNRPLPSIELLAQLLEWQRGEAIDLGRG